MREDATGTTLGRITGGMSGLASRTLPDGSTVYTGDVAAGLIARESGFKESMPIRVFPYGNVAHGEAANPSTPLRTSVTVGHDGLVHLIAVRWGGDAAWTYTVTFGDLGATARLDAPAGVQSLRALRALRAAGNGSKQ